MKPVVLEEPLRYAELHHHTTFSLYDGAGTPKQWAAHAAVLGYPALAITDHGNVNGLMQHYKACKDVGIHPVLGVEGYYQPFFDPEQPYYHVTVLCKTDQGYKNLCRMLTEANRDTFYRQPRFTQEMFERYHEGLIITSGCVAGFIPQMIIKGKRKLARQAAQAFQRLFGDDFLFEVQPFPVVENGIDIQKLVNEYILELASPDVMDVRVVMTSDAHYVAGDEYDSYLFLKEIDRAYNKKPTSAKAAAAQAVAAAKPKLTADYTHRHLHSAEQMAEAWELLMETDGTAYIEETVRVAEGCQVSLEFENTVPQLTWEVPATEKLATLAREGLEALGKWDWDGDMATLKKTTYARRLLHEFDVISYQEFESYFLMVWDMVDFCQQNDIKCQARGSVCGSLLAYAIGITQVDPIILGTDFERFMRKGKKVMPDIDMDIDSRYRHLVLDYIDQKYAGRSAPITNFGLYAAKGLINDMVKKYPAISVEEREELKNVLEEVRYDDNHFTFEQLLKLPGRGVFFRNFNKAYPTFLEHFCRLCGQFYYYGKHAAGIAITAGAMTDYMPLQLVKGQLQTQVDMNSINDMGLLKMDILGVSMLSTVKQVEDWTGCRFDYAILDDPRIYAKFAAGETDAIFQFSSPGMRKFLQEIKPANIQELIACNAMFRPGAKNNKDDYIRGKNGRGVSSDALWYEYTRETYGLPIYDNQKMWLARKLGHMQWNDVDKLVKQAKKGYIDEKYQKMFIDGAVNQSGMKEKDAKELIRIMALYAFNKGHAAGYALLAVYGMWLRMTYPTEYYCAALMNENDKETRLELEASAIKADQVILLPHINGGVKYELVEIDGGVCIRQGLETLEGVGSVSAKAIVAGRGDGIYTSEDELVGKVKKRNLNSKVLSALKNAGALEMSERVYLKRSMLYCSAQLGRASNHAFARRKAS